MCVLLTDLDNTMIYSHHRMVDAPKIVVEHLNGREQSFMTEFTYKFLSSSDWLRVIPITTRTEQQYKRIECASKLGFEYAIVCNGGKLLVNGVEDKEWTRQTHTIVQDKFEYLDDAIQQLSNLCKDDLIHRPDDYIGYVKCNNPENVYEKLKCRLDSTKVNVQRDDRKVYIFINGISKGSAVKRLKDRFHFTTILAAGDNTMDVPMLNLADYAIVSNDISSMVTCRNKYVISKQIISDDVCKYIQNMKLNGVI